MKVVDVLNLQQYTLDSYLNLKTNLKLSMYWCTRNLNTKWVVSGILVVD